MTGPRWSHGVRIARQGVQNEDRIRTVLIELAPRFKSYRHTRQRGAVLEDETLVAVPLQLDELTPTGVIANLPRARNRRWAHASLTARNPASRSARMSSIDSSPTESRTRSGLTPVVVCSSSVNCECVVEAGWIARLRTSPTFAK